MKNRFNKGFEETKQNKVPKYGIRKLKVGVVSCLLAFSMFAPAVGAHAEEVGPVHVNLDTDDKQTADDLYDKVNAKLKDIAKQISDELKGITQLEANIAKAQANADTAQKTEENAKKDLVQKRADYEAKKKEYAEAEANFNQRKAEKEAAKKEQEKAEKKHSDAAKKLKIAQDDFDNHAGVPVTEEDKQKRDNAKGKIGEKEKALQGLEVKNDRYKRYKKDRNVTKKEDLNSNDDIVIEALKEEQTVIDAITDAKKGVKYAADESTCKGAKESIAKFKEHLAAFAAKHGNDTKSKLEAINTPGKTEGYAKWTDDSLPDAKSNSELNADIAKINEDIQKEKDAINFDRDDISTIKNAKDSKLDDAKTKALTKIPANEEDTTAAKKELEDAKEQYAEAQHVIDAKGLKKDSAEKRRDKAEQKEDAAQDALDKAKDAFETAKDNFDAAEDKYNFAKAAKTSAYKAKNNAHAALTSAHIGFRNAKESLRLTIGVAKKGKGGDEKLGEKPEEKAERLGIEGLRNEVAKQLKKAEDEYSKVELVVTSKKDRIKLLQDLVASTKKFAAMASNTDAAESFDNVIDGYNTEIDRLSDEVADYSEKLSESTALITVIRQLAEKAKVLKPRNLKPEGWSQEGTDWTYTDSNGMTVKDNWVQGKNGDWFYLDGFGKMAHDKWVEVNKKWFYAGSNGVIAQEQWIQNKLGDWFYVKKGGYMAQNEWVQVKGQWYYAQKDGNMAKNVTLNVNGVNYSFNANCAWVK